MTEGREVIHLKYFKKRLSAKNSITLKLPFNNEIIIKILIDKY